MQGKFWKDVSTMYDIVSVLNLPNCLSAISTESRSHFQVYGPPSVHVMEGLAGLCFSPNLTHRVMWNGDHNVD